MSAPAGTSRKRRVRLALPLDIGKTMWAVQRGGRSDPTAQVSAGGAWRATQNRDGFATVHYSADGDGVAVEAWGPGAALELERAPGVLGADDSLDGFAPAGLVADLHRRLPGLRIGHTEAVFEALVPTVFEQKVIGAEARAGYSRMVRSLGQPAPGPGELLVAPGADRLAKTPYFDFHQFSLERRRAETLIGAARRANQLEATVGMAADAALARLQALPGIGAWTAAQVAMVALGDADAVSVGDYHLPDVVAWAFRGERHGDDAMMLELLEPYRGHRARVLRLLIAGGVGPPRRGPRLAFRRIELG